MRLIHLSDIHFGGYGPGWDPDDDQRHELLRDIDRLIDEGGPADGVLVGGDIAFKASKPEYDRAAEWLAEVVSHGKCQASQVWVVPGNHDVDRAAHEACRSRQGMVQILRMTELELLDLDILKWVHDPAAEILFGCFHEYNEFAEQWGCPTSPTTPHWTDMALGDLEGLEVCLTGLNSALFSDTKDNPENGPVLHLGTRQCELPRKPGRVQIAFGHHPPSWIRDWAQVRPYLRRAHLLLFGHEHAFGASQEVPGETVEVFAGAVGPERTAAPDRKFAPSWNLITLERDDDEIAVTIEPRVWLKLKTRFDLHEDGLSSFRVRVDLEAEPVDHPSQDDALEQVGTNPSPLVPGPTEVFEGVALPNPPERMRLRDLGLEFMRLATTRRLELARVLGVDAGLAEAELDPGEIGREILRRVRQADKIDDLSRMLNDA